MYVCIVYCMYCFDLKWNSHVDSINVSLIKKASKRLYFLRHLKRANVPAAEMICFYCTCIRPIVEYASPVFHYGIPNYLSKDIERIQLRAMRIIFPRSRKSYNEAISLSNLGKLEERRQATCDNLFKLKKSLKIQITNFAALLPDLNSNTAHSLRAKRTFDFPIIKTSRYMNTFIIASSKRFNSLFIVLAFVYICMFPIFKFKF